MSDKFFFKGRQDARQSHIQYGYQPQAKPRNGSKKYPLLLTVTSQERQQAVADLLAEANLYGVITLDEGPGANESIEALTALLNKTAPMTRAKTLARNEPCECGSGKKHKKCCALG